VVGTFNPAGTSYTGFSTVFTVAGGSHTISFQGLDTAGGDNTALIDNVRLIQVSAASVADSGFELPSVGRGFQYDPAGTPWTFVADAGVSGNGSDFTSGNPDAPEGTQVAFVQQTGSFSQVVQGIAAGTYHLTFSAAQRVVSQASFQDFKVLVDGTVVGTFTPSGSLYSSETTAAFTLASGAHTITFVGLDTAGGDNTAFIDNVQFA
jgi:hypothetical protein